jgi:hypothetical protein
LAAADAWAITPSMAMSASTCHITFFVKVQSATYPENLKFTVGTGNTVADQATILLDTTGLTNTAYQKWEVDYTPPTAGNYNFGFNCYSIADQWNVFVDSITITQTQPACSGTPIGGSLIPSSFSVCRNMPFSLNVTGATPGVSNLNYQWDSSTNGTTFFPIAGATNSAYTSARLATKTYYRRRISCGSGSWVNSTPDTVKINPAGISCYCSPLNGTVLHTATSPSIDNVTIPTTVLDISNTGVPTIGYTANSDIAKVPTLYKSLSYTLNVTTSAAATQAAVWIDWDQSGTFEASEYTLIPITSTNLTVGITVPNTAIVGNTVMRVRVRGANFLATDACGQFGSGETEDFVILVDNAAGCTGTPLSGNT